MGLEVVISGGGIGGLTAALTCRCRGYDVTVCEQADEISEVGAGLQISPNASRLLGDLGLREAMEEASFKPDALELRIGASGRRVFTIPMGSTAEERYGAPYYHIHRADLINILRQATEDVGGIHLKTSAQADSFEDDGARVCLLDASGNALAEGDVLIGADGVKSAIRAQLQGNDPAQFTGNVAWRAVTKATPELKRLIPPVAAVWTGDKRHAVTYYLRGGDLINFVGVVEQDDWTLESWSEPGDLAELANAFSSFAKPVRALIDNLDSCFTWALHGRPPLPFWSQGRVTLLGDAAHPMLPFQAQGAAQAIEDATVLARMLAAPSLGEMPERLKRYEEARKPRASRIQAASRANMSTFHKGSGLAAALTYGPMALAARAAPGFVASRQDWIYAYVA